LSLPLDEWRHTRQANGDFLTNCLLPQADLQLTVHQRLERLAPRKGQFNNVLLRDRA
jgi:hypothetical protein